MSPSESSDDSGSGMHFIPYGHQYIDEADIQAINEVLRSEWLTTGPKGPEFEQALCKYIGCKTATAVNSGTSALDIAVQALNFPLKSEVITTPFTFAATSNSILYNGLKPVFADIQKKTRNIDPDDIKRKITPKTKAIIYVDYAGQSCQIDEIKQIASENDLFLIEDGCHALGAEYKNKKIGTFADMTIFSFHPVKPITTGEGGAVVTDNLELSSKLKMLRSHGIDKEDKMDFGSEASWAYNMHELGRNYRMTDIQAALGLSQMNKIEGFIRRRNEIAELYHTLLSEYSFVEIPETPAFATTHGWHLYTILLKGIDRNRFYSEMKKLNVGVNVHYIPTYKFRYYQQNLPTGSLPVVEDVFNHIITLPLYPGMTDNEVHYIVKAVKTSYNNCI